MTATVALYALLLPGLAWGPQGPYEPAAPAVAHVERCQASWYGPGFHGRPTASGELFDQDALTAAHRTLPLGTQVDVSTGTRQIRVTVNDRGPFADQDRRCLDLSRAAFDALGDLNEGILDVTVHPR